MHWLISSFLVFIATVKLCSATERVGACPGIALESCECFERLYNTSIEIIKMTDIVARNWRITLTYQDIGHSIQKLLKTAPNSAPGLPAIITWPTMAKWASHVVGFSIREQSVQELWAHSIDTFPQWMKDILNKVPIGVVNVVFKQLLNHTAEALGGGNSLVFEQISMLYTRYGLEFCNDKTKPSDDKMERFIEKNICSDGQCNLAKALWAMFKVHYASSYSLTFSERDQLLLLQNMYAGFEEQTRLQPYINGSLPGYTTNWCRVMLDLDIVKCRQFVNTIVTRLMVHLLIGSHRVLADENVPTGVHNGSNFSPFLSTLSLTDVHNTMLHMLNSTTLDLSNTAASDWNNLTQRMRFISPLFWIFQDHREMNCYPFTPEQERYIRMNQSDKLDPHSWLQLCDKDCCAANGEWNGEN